MKGTVFLAFSCVLLVAGVSGQCVNTPTSEGLRDLPNGGTACGPLRSGETKTDKGKRYLVCDGGRVLTLNCPATLRYDTKGLNCNYPSSSTCQLPDPPNAAPQTSETDTETVTIAPPTTTTTTVKPAPTVKPAVTVTQKITTKPTTAKPTTTKPPIPTLKRAPSGSCSPTTCILPDCFCYGAQPVMPLADRPMFIMPTFDDAVTALQYNRFFEPLFVSNNTNIRNPNGCRMRSAYYVSHLDTDYSKVKMLYEAKNEIASHTIHHRLPLGNSVADYPDMVQEIDGLRHFVENQTGITGIRDKIVGFRAPYLRVAGDIMFDVLRDNNFLYDTSVLNINNQKGRLPLWPFTNDYLISDCVNPPCPTKPYPGLWEVPLNGWVGDNGFACSMIDACAVGTNIFTATQLEWEQFYMKNFKTYFYPNKIPQHFFTHGAMFLRSPNSYTAFVQWLKNVLSTHNDVWVVSPKEVIEWMKNPMTNAEMIRTKWGC